MFAPYQQSKHLKNVRQSIIVKGCVSTTLYAMSLTQEGGHVYFL